MHHPRLAYIVLAAGEAKRFGSCKQLATIDFKQTLLERALTVALDTAPGELFLVLGARRDAILQALAIDQHHTRIHLIDNRHWASGVASSVAAALAEIEEQDYCGALFMHADQVAVEAEHLKKMRDAWYNNPDNIVAACYRETCGPPAIIPARLFAELRKLKDDSGLRDFIVQQPLHTVAFALPQARWDIDTELELNDWQLESL